MISGPNDHVNATPIVRDAWRKLWSREGTANEILYSQAIASFETGYGRLGQFAQFAKDGKFNWGAEQRKPNADGTCPANFVLGKDNGNVCFYYYPSDVDAAANFLRTLTKSSLRPGVVAAMAGTPEDVARAMRGPNPPQGAYYEGIKGTEEQKVQAYADGIRARAKTIGTALKDAPLNPPNMVEKSSAGYFAYATLILGMAGSAYVLIPKKGKK
jgi:hypothetical protein